MAQFHLLFTDELEGAVAEIKAHEGQVTQIFTGSIFEALLPDDVDAGSLTYSRLEPPDALDETSRVVINAWRQLMSLQQALAAGTQVPEQPIPWDTPGFQPPGKIPPEDEPVDTVFHSRILSSDYIIKGSIAVAVLVVSGSLPHLRFSTEEFNNTVMQVMQGLQFLASESPSGDVTFVYEIRFITVNAQPPSSCTSFESCEAVWRDPALQQLGYGPGLNECARYVGDVRARLKTRWAYVGFFTKYPLYHFGYAGWIRSVMHYDNDGWGPNQINRVFAHETCHIFNAGDEYGECSCVRFGHLQVPNNNCRKCSTSTVPCLMDYNELTICHWTRGQLGWWPRIKAGMAVNTPGDKQILVFATAEDGNLWADAWSANTWRWSDLRKPATASLKDFMGISTHDQRKQIQVFITDDKGNVWVNWKTGDRRIWVNMFAPPGTTVKASMGTVTVVGGQANIFATGADDNLWRLAWSGLGWDWTNLGAPPGTSINASMGAITVDGFRPYVFVLGADGNLWVNWWSGHAWTWFNLRRPPGASIAASMGAVAVDGKLPYVFVKGSDGHLWRLWWNGREWIWSHHPMPSGVSIDVTMGTIIVDGSRPYVFMRGTDGNLWLQWWDGDDWKWTNQERPPGIGIISSMGAVAVDGSLPYVFIRGSDGLLWLRRWSGSAWSWSIA